jgi:hypothetical protein
MEGTMTTARRPAPWSLTFIPLAIASYLIQTNPTLGVFTMVMMGPTWPMLCIYATFLGTTVEAASGRSSRWWLLLPLTMICGYESMALRDHVRAQEIVDQVVKLNATTSIPFDPRKRSLTIVDGWDSRPPFQPVRLVADFELPAVWVHQRNAPEGVARYRSHRIATKAQCGAMGVVGGITDRMATGDSLLDERACHVDIPEGPKGMMDRIIFIRSERITSGMPVTMIRTIVSYADDPPDTSGMIDYVPPNPNVAIVRGGHVRPLSWMPFLLAGCGLDGSGPSWRCSYGFVRDMIPLDGNPVGMEHVAVGHALGLKWTGRDRRIIPSDPDMDGSIARSRAHDAEQAFQNAEAVMAGRIRGTTAEALQPIRFDAGRMERIAPRLIAWTADNIRQPKLRGASRICNVHVDATTPACVRHFLIADARTVLGVLSTMKDDVLSSRSEEIQSLEDSIRTRHVSGYEAKMRREARRRMDGR